MVMKLQLISALQLAKALDYPPYFRLPRPMIISIILHRPTPEAHAVVIRCLGISYLRL
jgi:hypothetical protein